MAHAWKACWCNSLTSSNLVSSARIGALETVEIIRFPGFCFGSFRLSVPSRYPPFGHLWPRPAARVTYRNRRFRKRLRAFARRVFVIEVRPRPMCPVSGPIRIPSCFPRSFFVLVRNNPRRPPRSAMRPMRSGPARRFPLTPSDERHTNAYGCHNSPFEPSIDSLIHRQEAEERPSVGWVRGDNGKPRRHPSPGYSPANGTGSAMTGQGEDMSPDPIRRKGRKTLAKVYDSLSDPE